MVLKHGHKGCHHMSCDQVVRFVLLYFGPNELLQILTSRISPFHFLSSFKGWMTIDGIFVVILEPFLRTLYVPFTLQGGL